ncbi:MAG: hypothetical protein IPH80_19625 [Myxococcales bacterium]|nr:hypothetical protein [Myxococcales bacterium]
MRATRQDIDSSLRFDDPSLADIIARTESLLTGHFCLLSGRHSDRFLRYSTIGRDAKAAREIAQRLAARLPSLDSIVVPESAGLYLGGVLANILNASLVVVGVDSRRRPTGQLRRGRIAAGAKVLAVNDIATSRRSLDLLCALAGPDASVVGAAAFVHHSGVERGAVALTTLGVATWPIYDPEHCPQCRRGLGCVWAGELS